MLPAYDATMLRGPLLSKASSRFVVAAMCSNAGAGTLIQTLSYGIFSAWVLWSRQEKNSAGPLFAGGYN